MVVNVANGRAEATFVEGDSRPAAAATAVVDLVVVGFQRYEVYRGPAVEDGEVWQRISPTRRGRTLPVNENQGGDEQSSGSKCEPNQDQIYLLHVLLPFVSPPSPVLSTRGAV